MESEDHTSIEAQEGEAVEIYSKRVVFWFALLLGPIFGSALLMLNLKEVGYKKAANKVLIFTIIFDCLARIGIVLYVKYSHIDLVALQQKMVNFKYGEPSSIDGKTILLSLLDLGLALAGALIISQYFFKKYFPENDYYPKSFYSILPLSILVWVVFQFIGLGGI